MRGLSYFLIFLFLFSGCFAATSSVTNVKASAFPGETLEYIIAFVNDGSGVLEINIQSFLLQKAFNTTVDIKPSINLEIPAGESGSVNISIPTNPFTEPGLYVIPLYVNYIDASSNVTKREFLEANVLSSNHVQNLIVASQSSSVANFSLINESSVKSEDLFGKIVSKVIVNNGNESVSVNINYSMSVLEPLLLSKAVVIINNGESSPVVSDYFISQVVSLSPGESVELLVEFDYGSLLLAPFFVILTLIAMFFFTKRLVIKKEIIECRKEAGELMIKVGISVRNISLRSVSDVRIIEDLPVYASKAGGFGSIHGEISKEKGTITFSPGRLDPKEEVLITYKFMTDVDLDGRVNLPPATVKYVVKNKVNSSKSNTPTIQLIKQ